MLGGFAVERCFLHYTHLLDSVVSHILAELRDLLMLLNILHNILLGLFRHHAVVSLHLLHVVDVLVTLEDVHLCRLAFLIRHIVRCHLVVIRAKFL